MEQQRIKRKVNPRAKRLSLRVDQRDGSLKLTVPQWTPQWQIDRFLNKNAQWIAQRQANTLPKIFIENGAIIPLKGVDRIIRIEHHTKRITDISLDHDDLVIRTSRSDPTTNLKRWLVDQARQAIELLAYDKAKTIGKTIEKIDLRDTTSRWGSCSSDKRLMFSWRLIMTDPQILDYVVAHEVAHLKHMNHSTDFWDLCYFLTDGDAPYARQWLKDNGNSLMRYF